MSLKNVQPFLNKAFEFLRDREFSVSHEDWKTFYINQGINLDQLKSAKSELIRQSQKVDDDSERLKQIFCCDPFDAGSTKALRDIWHDKAELQPDPFQRWFSDISIHLLDLSSNNSSKLQDSTSVTQVIQLPNLSPENKLPRELFSAIIIGGTIGIFTAIGLIINNYLNKSQIITQKEQVISTPSTILVPKNQDSTDILQTSSEPINSKSEMNSLDNKFSKSTEDSLLKINQSDAINTIESLYIYLSDKDFYNATLLYSPYLQKQFNPNFFTQFIRVTVEDLQITSQTDNSINLVGINTYVYPNGSTQREKRSYTVRLLDGEFKITSSEFIKVIKLRK